MEIGGADTDKCSHRTGYITGRYQLYVKNNKRLSSRTAFVFYTKNIMNHKKFILINSGCKGRGFRGFVQYLKLGFLQNT